MIRSKAMGLGVGLVLLTMLGGPGSSAADPQPMTAGMHPRPTTSTQVAIAREELLINIGSDAAEVTAAIWLKNRGKASTIQVGFPCDVSPDESVSTLPCTTKLDISLNGRSLWPRKRPTSRTVHNWIWAMRLAEGEEAKLDISYRAPLLNDRYAQPVWGMEALYYRLVTGAAWAGPIGQLDIEVRVPGEALAFIAPRGYTRSPGRIRWSLANFEPVEDLLLLFAGTPFATQLSSVWEGHSEYERIDSVERALADFANEPRRLLSVYRPLRFFGSQWQVDEDEYRRCLKESATFLEARLPLRWKLFKQRILATNPTMPWWRAEEIYLQLRGVFVSPSWDKRNAGPFKGMDELDQMALTWLEDYERNPGLALHVAVARALGGDGRGAERIRDAIAEGPPLVVARGLAAMKIPVCSLIEERLPDEWVTYIKKATPPAIEPGTSGLGRELAQKETRLRLLQLMSRGADGDCLAFVTEEASSKTASSEERALAQAILRQERPSSIDEPSLKVIDRRLADPDVRVRLAAARILAARTDGPAARFRAALKHSDFCESRLLSGAGLEEAREAREDDGCAGNNLGAMFSALLSAGNLTSAAALLEEVLKAVDDERARIALLGEWLASRSTQTKGTH